MSGTGKAIGATLGILTMIGSLIGLGAALWSQDGTLALACAGLLMTSSAIVAVALD